MTMLLERVRRSPDHRLTVYLLVSQLWLAGGALLINVLSARYLGPAGRGELALYLQISYSVNLLAFLGRNRSYLATSAGVDRIAVALREMGALTRLPLAIAAITAVVVAAFLGGAGTTSFLLAGALCVMMAGGILLATHRTIAIVTRRADSYLRLIVVTQTLLAVGAIILLVSGRDSVTAWLAVYGGTAVVPCLAAGMLIRRRDPTPGRDALDLEATRRLGARLLPAGIWDAILTRADRYLLPLLASFQQLGIYAVVSTVTELINWPLKQYIDSKTPRWTAEARAATLRPWYILRTTALWSAVVAAGVGSLTYLILVPVFGSAYQDGARLVLPLAAASGLYSLGALGVALATACHRPRLAGWVSGSGMVAAIPLYVVLIPPLGAYGAALGSLAGYAVSAAVGVVAVARVAQTVGQVSL